MEHTRKRWFGCAAVVLAAVLAIGASPVGRAIAEVYESITASDDAAAYTVVINEVESSDADGGNDWVEIINTGDEAVDIGGWFVSDDGGLERLTDGETTPLSDGTTLQPGQILVLEEGVDFTCGLGKSDAVTLYDSASNVVDTYSWTAHASGTYSRVSDGIGDFVDQDATKGTLNDPSVVVINEVESSDADGGNDWVEIKNVGEIPVYITGWFLSDDGGLDRLADGETTPIAEAVSVSAGGYYVFEENVDFTCGLGKADAATVYDSASTIVATYSWTAHASGTYSRVPDGTGDFVDQDATKGYSNDATEEDDDAAADEAVAALQALLESAVETWTAGGDGENFYTEETLAALYEQIEAVSTYLAGESYTATEISQLTESLQAALDALETTTGEGDGGEAAAYTVAINEVESSDPDGGADWVELYNYGTEEVDVSGWYVLDDDSSHEAQPLADGTTIEAGGFLVLEDGTDFDFGLGKADTATLYDADGNVVDTYTWTAHASGTYSRVPDGTGDFVDQDATKGYSNESTGTDYGDGDTDSALVINEVNSSPDDWVELMNVSDETIDVSGWEIRDNSDDHRWQFAEGTTVEAGALVLVEADTVGLYYDDTADEYVEGSFVSAIGIGSADSIRLYDADGNLVDSVSWTEHASYDGDAALASIGRYPDGTGSYCLMKETPGEPNEWYAPEVVVNEVESKDPDGGPDWVEIKNVGTTAIDISGWFLCDNNGLSCLTNGETTPIADGTTLEPGEYYVFYQYVDFEMGLGGTDCATVYNADQVVVCEYSWETAASGVYARIPDGTGEMIDFATATPGACNLELSPVVINEIESYDEDGGSDWIELANPTDEEIDVSGLTVVNAAGEVYTIPDGTTIDAGGYLVISDLGYDLGEVDSLTIYQDDYEVTSVSWTEHADPTLGLYPDYDGYEYQATNAATPGEANTFDGIPDVIAWPGTGDSVTSELTFLEDSSGLDFYNGQLYAVDNGTATVWVLDYDEDGTLSFAEGFEDGKIVQFQKDAGDTSAYGPDAEGITVAGDGTVYLASERDNGAKGVNYDTILAVDIWEDSDYLVASAEWDITSALPDVSANMGIEAIEWVSFDDLDGLLWDENTDAAFDPADYEGAVADGVFFVALEDNGHVYGFVLYEDGTYTLVSDTDGKLGCAMALDYDEANGILWIATDDGTGNMSAMVTFDGTDDPTIVHVEPAEGVTTTNNNEGFCIVSADYATEDGLRAVFRFCDGLKSGQLTVNYLYADYAATDDDGDGDGGDSGDSGEGDGTGEGDDTGDDAGDAGGDDGGDAASIFVELFGANRYTTMQAVVAEAFAGETSEYAVLATGTNYADALTAASLAGALDAPIVLVNDSKVDVAIATLESVGARYVYVVGGSSAVSDTVVSAIEAGIDGLETERVFGADRYETAVEVAEKTSQIAGEGASATAIVATGANFADALSASPYAYWSGSPIYLADKNGGLSEATLSAIAEGGYTRIVVVGGTSAVGADAYAQLEDIDGASVERVFGSNRYETSTAMAEWSVEEGMSYNCAAIVTGKDFPDALSATSLCGRSGSVVLLAKDDVVAGIDGIAAGKDIIGRIYFIGGTDALSDSARGIVEAVFAE